MNSNMKIQDIVINTIRTLSMDAVQKANSGHPGAPMALAPIGYILWDKFLRFNPNNPTWANRDRIVLSAGHASMLLYSLLHITGFGVSLEDIKNFRQLHSICAGHPEYSLEHGIETTTGPLGQGIGNSVGMAMAEKWLKTYFNRPGHDIIDYRVFAIASDGCIMEGISHEAASLAGHLGLGNLIWIYDNNHITIEGSTELAFSDDVAKSFSGYHWHVQRVEDGNDLTAIERSLQNAIEESDTPSLIILDTHIAYGSPNKQDTADAHGSPLGEEEVRATKRRYGWDPDAYFLVPDEAKKLREQFRQKGAAFEDEWTQRFKRYAQEYPDLAGQFRQFQNGEIPTGWEDVLPDFPPDEKGMATRKANGQILNAVSSAIPWFLGGSADLAPSNKTLIDSSSDFAKANYKAVNLHFGVREHAMGTIANGLALSKLRPFAGTFLVFSDYMRPAIRLAAMMKLPVIYIFTHDSIGLGEDGPTHQPIEHLASLRAIPHLEVIRPGDAQELSVLWKHILQVRDHPVALVLTRQPIPTLDRKIYASAEGALKGGYVLADSAGDPDVILMSTGSEVHLCLRAFEQLNREGIKSRMVSMPSWELFDEQDKAYRESVLPGSARIRIAVEAGAPLGWHKYVGNSEEGIILGLTTFGASAPYQELYQEYGLTPDNIVKAVKEKL